MTLALPKEALTPMGQIEAIGAFGRAAQHGRGPAYRAARWFFWIFFVIPTLLLLAFYVVGFVVIVAGYATGSIH